MRLVDRLIAGLVAPSPWTQLPEWATSYEAFIETLASDVRQRPVIAIDNVAEYTLGEDSRGRWDRTDFPNAAPPWPSAWFEYKAPPRVREAVRVQSIALWLDSQVRDDGGWTLFFWPFAIGQGEHTMTGPISRLSVEVARDGVVERLQAYPAGLPEGQENEALIFLVPVLMAVSFAHCRNVSEEEVRPAAKLSSRHKQRYGAPLSRYRVLRIDPMRETLRSEGRSDEVGLRRALHICRGHFKTFDEKPLFGRHQGTYFWPEHVRGHADRGSVRKDYIVLSPQADGSLEASSQRNLRTTVPDYPSAEHAKAIEVFSVGRARELSLQRWPDSEVVVEAHSNPGYDLRVIQGEAGVRYVEVKGTTREHPGFFMSEVERRFSVEHAGQYSLLVVAAIDLETGRFDHYWHDGRVDERFMLRPVQWRAEPMSDTST